MSRLKLDFSLNTNSERLKFIEDYINKSTIKFTKDELEMMGNYILWGKAEDTGLSPVDEKIIEIETRNKTWARTDVDSLDELMESPTFNENLLRPVSQTPLRKRRETFDRDEERQRAPDEILPYLEDLWKNIDTVELGINFYELKHNKRKNPPRPQLLNKFTEEEQQHIKENSESWNQYKYLKNRHLLVELRREQFTMRDFYISQIYQHSLPSMESAQLTLDFDSDITVLPFGVINNKNKLFFKPIEELNPYNLKEEELKLISDFYWKKQKEIISALSFDFRNTEHLFNLIDNQLLLEFSSNNEDIYNKTQELLQTLEYYISFADLTDIQSKILDMKIHKVKNHDIAQAINKEYQKKYTDNYISTIFRQKILPNICKAVEEHQEIIENIYYPEAFKRCSCCGRYLLRNNTYFICRSRSRDGLSARCKKCDKLARQSKKESK